MGYLLKNKSLVVNSVLEKDRMPMKSISIFYSFNKLNLFTYFRYNYYKITRGINIMKEVLEKLIKIIEETAPGIEYVGMVIYLLTSEEQPYKVYRLNIEKNATFENILLSNILRINLNEINICNYIETSNPKMPDEIAYLSLDNILIHEEIINTINNSENNNILSKSTIENIISKSKGYLIKVMYSEYKQDRDIYAYFRMTQSAFLTGKDVMFKFSNEDGSLLRESKEPQLKFGDKLVSITIEDTMFILNANDFEILLKYHDLINQSSEIALNNLETKGILNNFDEFRSYCLGSTLMKKKLYKIMSNGNIDNITVENFIEAKRICGDKLDIEINQDNTISFNMCDRRKSIDHILRVYNDEGAETIISKKPIFADKKIEI